VEIVGDEEAETALNYSLYHLNCIAPRNGEAMSIPARGLSGQTYKGAVFWDSEMFMLDYFLYTQPETARSLVRYRIDSLDGARAKAAQYGWQGAFYAWESQEGGFDACSDYNVTDVFTGRPVRTYFRDKQVHISSAVVRAVMEYVKYTGDLELLSEGGALTVLECARFYWSLLVRYLSKDRYELHDVIGPDEYPERVNNNAYTNRMALYCFDSAIEISELLQSYSPRAYEKLEREAGLSELLDKLRDARAKLYIPQADSAGVIEQFDGYFSLEDASLEQVRSRLKDEREYWGGGSGVASDTQIIKQADVVTMLEMFHEEYPEEILRENWLYYDPRTEHGSSLSACMYAMLACRFGRADLAYPFFMKSATAEIRGGGKQWAGLVYIGGTHPAAAGGAWRVLAQAFAGLHIKDGEPRLSPCLPPGWKRLRLRFAHRGKQLLAELTPESAQIRPINQESGKGN
jgi:kojibiose phosphorylase/nigerose phosphorylase